MGAPQYTNAVGHLEAATSMNPNLHPAHLQLGQILRDMGHFERAIARYKKVLSVRKREEKPDDEEI